MWRIILLNKKRKGLISEEDLAVNCFLLTTLTKQGMLVRVGSKQFQVDQALLGTWREGGMRGNRQGWWWHVPSVSAGVINRELVETYQLTVQAVVAGTTEHTYTYTITVLDENDNSPSLGGRIYNLNISEDTPVSAKCRWGRSGLVV